MKRLLLSILSVLLVSPHLSRAQSCKVDVITLASKVEANPGSVLYALGDAIALNPGCMSDLLEAAIVAAKPDPDTLTQIIQLVVSEYPSRVGEIAEAAVLASPDDVDVIRKAFVPARKPIVATPVFETPENPSPIENFLYNYESNSVVADAAEATPPPAEVSVPGAPIEFQTSKPADETDSAVTAMKSIDGILAKLKGKGPDGRLADEEGVDASRIETFRMDLPDAMVGITTISDPGHRDRKDEALEGSALDPLVIRDPAADPLLVGPIKEMTTSESEVPQSKPEPTVSPMEFTSSVYYIPSLIDSRNRGEWGIAPPVIRSLPVSATMPRAR